jgi:ribosomal protein L23
VVYLWRLLVSIGSVCSRGRSRREFIFDVKVTNVNTLNRKGKVRRNRRNNTLGKRPDSKRAIVTLAEGDSIQIFES